MIVPMKRLTLIALNKYRGVLLRALQDTEAVHVIPADETEVDDMRLQKWQAKLSRLKNAARAVAPYAKKAGVLEPKPEVTVGELKSGLNAADGICSEIEAVEAQISNLKAHIVSTRQLISALTPWQDMDTQLQKITSTHTTKFITGIVSHKTADELNIENACVTVFKNSGTKAAVLIACRDRDYDVVMSAVKDTDFTEYIFPKELRGTPEQNIRRLEKEEITLRDELENASDRLKRIGEKRGELLLAADATKAECDREAANMELLRTQSSFKVEGWIRSDETDKVKKAIQDVCDSCYIEIRDPGEDEIPPSVVKNNEFFTPFEAVTNMYAKPSPYGIDATPFMAPFYILYFGMMTSDSGYGLLLFLIGWLYVKFKKPRGVFGSIMTTIKWGGLCAIVCGFFIGTFFGMQWNDLFGTDIFPLLFDPLAQSIPMLVLCCGMGLFQMLFGLGIKAYMSWKRGDTSTAIFDCISWIFVMIGLVGVFAFSSFPTPFVVLAVLGLAMILLFSGRDAKSIGGRIGKGLFSLYDVTGYISDTLSYARIYALGLVTGAMGDVFNSLGAMLMDGGSGVVGKILSVLMGTLVLIALHSFSLFINTLGTFAHTARLQYVEFYGKFYEAGGRDFKPLGFNTENVNIKK